MNTQSISLQWKERRRKKIFFAALMLVLLVLSAPFFFFARYQLNQSKLKALDGTRMFQDALQMEANLSSHKRLNESARKLQEIASQRGLVPTDWAERLLNLRQASLSRNEANEFLLSIARTDNRFFNVEEFEIAVAREEEGMFSSVSRLNSPLLMTVHGALVFRAKGVTQ